MSEVKDPARRALNGDSQTLKTDCSAIRIREHVQAAPHLRDRCATAERLSMVASRTTNGVVITDAQRRVEWVNDGFTRISGYTLEEVRGNSPGEVLQGVDTDPATIALMREHLDRDEGFTVELKNYRKSGEVYWVRVDVDPLVDEAGRVTGFMGIETDITDRKRAEEQIREREASFRNLFNTVTEAIYIQDRQGRFLDLNRGAIDLFGFTKEEVLGQTPAMLAAPGKNDLSEDFERLKKAFGGEPQRFEWWGQRKSGEVFPVDLMLNKGQYLSEPVVVATLREITEQKEYEEALVQAKERAEEMNRLKSAFLASMSHEIRTPLTNIIGFSECLDHEVMYDEDGPRAFVRSIHANATRLLETLNSVLDLAQLEGNSLNMHLEPIDVGKAVADTVALFEEQARSRGISLSYSAPTERIEATQDVQALNRVTANLLSNAIKFTREGGVAVSVTSRGAEVEVRVEDTGIGIGPDFLPHVFDDFKQESTGMARGYEGSGLGLTITKRLVELVGGRVEVESEKGKGSVFRVLLPRGG